MRLGPSHGRLWQPHTRRYLMPDEVLNSPRLLNLPLLLLANKQDKDTSLTVAEVRESFDAWQRARPERASVPDSPQLGTAELPDEDRAQRMASLDVLGVSALEGCVRSDERSEADGRTGVRETVDWLYIRVQNSRQV